MAHKNFSVWSHSYNMGKRSYIYLDLFKKGTLRITVKSLDADGEVDLRLTDSIPESEIKSLFEELAKIYSPTAVPSQPSSITQARQINPRAYEPWTDNDDALLRNLKAHGKSIEEMMSALGRNEGAIKSRLKKFGL